MIQTTVHLQCFCGVVQKTTKNLMVWSSGDTQKLESHLMLTLVLLNKDAKPTSNFQPIRLLDLDFCYKFTFLMANSADPDQLASSEAN